MVGHSSFFTRNVWPIFHRPFSNRTHRSFFDWSRDHTLATVQSSIQVWIPNKQQTNFKKRFTQLANKSVPPSTQLLLPASTHPSSTPSTQPAFFPRARFCVSKETIRLLSFNIPWTRKAFRIAPFARNA